MRPRTERGSVWGILPSGSFDAALGDAARLRTERNNDTDDVSFLRAYLRDFTRAGGRQSRRTS
eukprot:4588195-Pleurochrysis_carterae.AAC.1